MGKISYRILVVLSVIIIVWFVLMAIARPVHAKANEPEIVEIISIFDEAGNRGTAVITCKKITFSIEVKFYDGEIVKVDNWRTASYDMNDVMAVSDKIHCIGEYYPPKYSNFKITRKIFSKAGR